jgi:hypothetical protein
LQKRGEVPQTSIQSQERIQDGRGTAPALFDDVIKAIKFQPEHLKLESFLRPMAGIQGKVIAFSEDS